MKNSKINIIVIPIALIILCILFGYCIKYDNIPVENLDILNNVPKYTFLKTTDDEKYLVTETNDIIKIKNNGKSFPYVNSGDILKANIVMLPTGECEISEFQPYQIGNIKTVQNSVNKLINETIKYRYKKNIKQDEMTLVCLTNKDTLNYNNLFNNISNTVILSAYNQSSDTLYPGIKTMSMSMLISLIQKCQKEDFFQTLIEYLQSQGCFEADIDKGSYQFILNCLNSELLKYEYILNDNTKTPIIKKLNEKRICYD